MRECVCSAAANSLLAFLGVIGLFWSKGITAGEDMWSDSGFYDFRVSYLIVLFSSFIADFDISYIKLMRVS